MLYCIVLFQAVNSTAKFQTKCRGETYKNLKKRLCEYKSFFFFKMHHSFDLDGVFWN